MSSPTILQIIPQLSAGGAERTVIEVAEAVAHAGGRALVASEGGRLAGELAEVGGELIPFPAAAKNPARLLLNARRLAALIRERRVDLVHARSRAPAWSAYLAARWTKRPFVTTYHGIYNQKSALKAWYNGVMARGQIVIANSHYTASIVRERHGVPEDRLHVIPRAVDLDKFSRANVDPERIARLREAWGVPHGARVILQASRLTRWKGQGVVIGAAGLLKASPRFEDAVIVLAGDHQGRNAYREELVARIASLGLADRILLPGHCADMPAAFGAAWLALVPSIEPEAFGRASIEAQAMGCPVIVSDIGALPETLPAMDGLAPRSGWLVEAGNEAALAEALEAGLEMSAGARSSMGNAAERHARGFSKAVLQKKTLQLYDYLLRTELAKAFSMSPRRVEFAHHSG